MQAFKRYVDDNNKTLALVLQVRDSLLCLACTPRENRNRGREGGKE